MPQHLMGWHVNRGLPDPSTAMTRRRGDEAKRDVLKGCRASVSLAGYGTRRGWWEVLLGSHRPPRSLNDIGCGLPVGPVAGEVIAGLRPGELQKLRSYFTL
nr:hypothetical protein GCM10017611_12340 [Rhodococcus wratislaviensis]